MMSLWKGIIVDVTGLQMNYNYDRGSKSFSRGFDIFSWHLNSKSTSFSDPSKLCYSKIRIEKFPTHYLQYQIYNQISPTIHWLDTFIRE